MDKIVRDDIDADEVISNLNKLFSSGKDPKKLSDYGLKRDNGNLAVDNKFWEKLKGKMEGIPVSERGELGKKVIALQLITEKAHSFTMLAVYFDMLSRNSSGENITSAWLGAPLRSSQLNVTANVDINNFIKSVVYAKDCSGNTLRSALDCLTKSDTFDEGKSKFFLQPVSGNGEYDLVFSHDPGHAKTLAAKLSETSKLASKSTIHITAEQDYYSMCLTDFCLNEWYYCGLSYPNIVLYTEPLYYYYGSYFYPQLSLSYGGGYPYAITVDIIERGCWPIVSECIFCASRCGCYCGSQCFSYIYSSPSVVFFAGQPMERIAATLAGGRRLARGGSEFDQLGDFGQGQDFSSLFMGGGRRRRRRSKKRSKKRRVSRRRRSKRGHRR